MISAGNINAAYVLINENLHDEIDNLKEDPQYCVLAATAYLHSEKQEKAFDIITIGLLADNHCYELYLTLGEYYGRTNSNMALICFYQALFYCENEEDRKIIEEYINETVSDGAEIHKVSIIIVADNQLEELKRCTDSIASTVISDMYEIIVIDNASSDGTSEWLSEKNGIIYVHCEKNIGYTAAVNQGIRFSNPFNDIFLLDADCMLTDNSFFYLMLGLYADENVGVIGGLTNEFIIEQMMYTDTSDLEEAQKQAVFVNSPMKDAYEKAVYVSDHAALIRRKALEKTGLFDEVFSPDLYEDKDLCTRIILSGMTVFLCFNSYIFKFADRHLKYGSNSKLEKIQKEKFVNKWGFNIDYSNTPRDGIIKLITADPNKPIEVLELGCAMGSTLNRIKRLWPHSAVHGIEYVNEVARVGGYISDIIQGDVENMVIPYSLKQFDYIICADVLEHLRNPLGALKRFIPYLKDDGRFIISLPNIRHFGVLMMLILDGRFDYQDDGILDSTHLKFFTKDTAIEMIEDAGLLVETIERNYNGHPEDNDFIIRAKESLDISMPNELKVFQYYFVARKK
ncbi:bifunctional glycosyltransferase/class I SAM-dependent methyltransferase [Butyrivibrio fibrisolvens]|uniref:bifunctional glycosyltransferase/class I SAM-dependent methyltransferase n=1 Tax=Butyrivibrio fibrisolvens TaxID=831 RepID=UPI0018AD5CEF|nr:bifunctional glycosyltransferase/class I SAM-dependent methyltransferase [Butyrivibrio fibrisolvens]